MKTSGLYNCRDIVEHIYGIRVGVGNRLSVKRSSVLNSLATPLKLLMLMWLKLTGDFKSITVILGCNMFISFYLQQNYF
jgi:hypothetical protein